LTSGGIIIPKDKFQEFVEFSKEMGRRKIKEIGSSSKGRYIRSKFRIAFQNGSIYDINVGYTEVI